MDGPESLYRKLTSGNPGTLSGLENDLRDAVRDLAGCIDTIVLAAGVPAWSSPEAAERFGRRAWATEAMAQVAQVRCDRAKLAMARAGTGYATAGANGGTVIEWWRTEKERWKDVPIFFLLVRGQAIQQLEAVEDTYNDELRAAKEMFDNEELDAYQEAWFGQGLLKLMQYDLENPTNLGPPIPDSLLGGDDDHGLAAQGLGVDPATGNLLQTSYNDDGESVLSVIDPDTGEVLNTVNLGAGEVTDGGDDVTRAPDHAGGVMVDGDTVYVTSSTDPPSIYEYPLSQVNDMPPGSTVTPSKVNENFSAGAYSTIDDGVLYVGTHNEDGPGEVQRYVKRGGEWQEYGDPLEAPRYAQGISVRDGVAYYTSSLGRGNDPGVSTLHAVDIDSGEELGTEALPNMAEGVVATDDGLVVTYESGSSKYQDPSGSAEFGDLLGSPNMTVTPYSEVGVGEIEVETVTLHEARSRFREASDRLDTISSQIGRLFLPHLALGEVDLNSWFAYYLVTHLDETSQWLENGNISANITADGLAEAAEAYDESDHTSEDDINRLLGLL